MRTRIGLKVAVVVGLVGWGWGSGRAAGQAVVFVDASAAGMGNGSSWADAYTSVQPAIDVSYGKRVWVAVGTYVGTITLRKNVALYGGFAGNEDPATFDLADRDLVANETILDGNQAGCVVMVQPGTTAGRLDGFTITNGSGVAYSTARSGGGVYIDGSSPTIANNKITGNGAIGMMGKGGGLFLRHSAATIINNTITDNRATSQGGGLYLEYSSATISGNTITGGRADNGGGLYVGSDSAPTITANRIAGNEADSGGGLSLDGAAGAISGNTISHNRAFTYGAGLYVLNSDLAITNNRIVGNAASGSYGQGGGLYLHGSVATIANNAIMANGAFAGGGLYLDDRTPLVVNNTIANNGAWRGGGLFLYYSSPTIANTIVAFNSSGIYGSSSQAKLRHNCVFGNTAYNYLGGSDPTGTGGNISVDPRLADVPYGNWHIQPDSPGVDAGSNGWVEGVADLDGQLRIQPLYATVDMGADESDETVWPTGPQTIVRVRPGGNDELDGSSWALAKGTVQAGIDAASAVGGEVWVQAGTYYECVMLHPYAYVYGGFGGGETGQGERDWRANIAILDGEQLGSVVVVGGGWGGVSAIDGFTVMNGAGTMVGNWRYGGGFLLSGASPTIAHCTVTGNIADYGGGLAMNYSSPVIVSCTVAGNNAASRSGGGLYETGSSPTIANSKFTGNTALATGGGLYLLDGSPTMVNSTVVGNSAGDGGAVYVNRSAPKIWNTIVAFNSSGIWGAGGRAQMWYNCVYGNVGYNYSGTDYTGTYGNISVDPRLVQSPRDVRLSAGSPCIDAGNNDLAAGALDLDGRPRVLDGDEDGAAVVDMGAYEYLRDCNGNGVWDGEEVAQGTSVDCNTNGVPDECDIAVGSSGDCNTNGIPDECESDAPYAQLLAAETVKVHTGRGPQAIAINLAGRVELDNVTSEPRVSGLTELRFDFDRPPGGPGADPVTIDCQPAPGGAAADYAPCPETDYFAVVAGSRLTLWFPRGLPEAQVCRLTCSPGITSKLCQSVEVRALVGDVNGDGMTDSRDRSVVVGIWTGSGFSPETDVDLSGRTGAADRSIVVAKWTGSGK